ncbi:hypothetical protein Y032_0061g3212 [Ancylostoma ceylanicum]|uniref:ADP/ATP translocase n=1 Tax=Ancylostoma ceylanicum TaxID=53326 RepID=A0A016U2W4_9BILA|nr:hypothetical protein Y032_0061g3212 [Ancylostoma ceylanicum]
MSYFRGFIVSVQGIIIYRAAYFGMFDTAKYFIASEGKKLNFFFAWALAQVYLLSFFAMIEWLWTEIFWIVFVLNVLRVSLAKEDLCPAENPVSYARRNLMVYDHNIYRLRIAQGVAINNRSNPLPRGSNIYSVEWSCYLEILASLAVRDCPNKMAANSLYALNYEHIESTDDYYLDNPYHLALKKWVYAVRDNSFSSNATFEGGGELLPFTNMVRANTTHIGCSQRRCGKTAAVACFYDSPEMVKDEAIYKIGYGCSSADECTSHPGSYCDTESGLCIAPEIPLPRKTKQTHEAAPSAGSTDVAIPPMKQPMRTNISNESTPTAKTITGVSVNNTSQHLSNLETSTTNHAHNQGNFGSLDLEVVPQLPGGNTLCPESAAMSDELRGKILSEHNTRRSLLARGFVKRANGRPLPAAGNMMKLVSREFQ